MPPFTSGFGIIILFFLDKTELFVFGMEDNAIYKGQK